MVGKAGVVQGPEQVQVGTPDGRGVGRRAFLAGATGTGLAATALARSAAAAAGVLDPPFRHGVASGDPLADAVIIWTRVTPSAEATPGSGVGPLVNVDWQVATDLDFGTVVASGTFPTGPARDHTVKVDVKGLAPDTDHWFRFVALDTTSPVGRTRTIPAPDATVESVRFGVATCAEWEFGEFGAYGRLAERDDIDAVLHLGDYIYEFGLGYGPVASPGSRTHLPEHETVTLEDYRIRFAQYHGDVGSLAMHAAHPLIVMYDDHEIANDVWREGAQNHNPEEGEGDFATRAAAARQAFREWLPIREDVDDPGKVHRRFTFGDLVDLWMVDERRYRDAPPMSGPFSLGSVDPAITDPDRTMLGLEQRAWLLDGMAASPACWKVVGNPVPFTPFTIGPAVPDDVKAALGPVLDAAPVTRPAYYVDDWNGWIGERGIIFEAWKDIDDVVVLTGDTHEASANDLPLDPGTYAVDPATAAVEFTAPSVTSPGNSETIELTGAPEPIANQIDTLFVTNYTTSNTWVKYHDGFRNGFGVVDFDRSRAHYDYHFLDDRNRADSPAPVDASWKADKGDPHVQPAGAALGSRSRTRGQVDPTPSTTTPTTAAPSGGGSLPATGGRSNLLTGAVAAAAGLAVAAARWRTRRQP